MIWTPFWRPCRGFAVLSSGGEWVRSVQSTLVAYRHSHVPRLRPKTDYGISFSQMIEDSWSEHSVELYKGV